MINYSKIKGRIVELGLTQDNVAGALEMSQSTFNLKLNGKRKFTIEECAKLKSVLSISNNDACDYFFTN